MAALEAARSAANLDLLRAPSTYKAVTLTNLKLTLNSKGNKDSSRDSRTYSKLQ